jgi:hypothetical protein
MTDKKPFEINNPLIGKRSPEEMENLRKALAKIFTPEWEIRQERLAEFFGLRGGK